MKKEIEEVIKNILNISSDTGEDEQYVHSPEYKSMKNTAENNGKKVFSYREISRRCIASS